MGTGNSRGWFSDVSGVFNYGTAKPVNARISSEAVATSDTTLLYFDANRVSSRYSNDATKIYAAGIGVHFIIKY